MNREKYSNLQVKNWLKIKLQNWEWVRMSHQYWLTVGHGVAKQKKRLDERALRYWIKWSHLKTHIRILKLQVHVYKYRSSHQRCSVRKGVLRNFAKFIGRHLCQHFFFNKTADPRPATVLKKDSGTVFSCELSEISNDTFFTEHLWATSSASNKIKGLND